ncbi:hypothetical protein CTA2_6397 [Colletotrichum tanaceti]|uniref:Short-chain dehydrogenase TIC 32, chloroplastic n=1 Tax=Colletotrichum tanaceti TaxID=1306861 RepID=A0A4U6XT34_9PEZI|nr:hypothetical protein CTA2_6397 [Colletotrichum tanaceti]TKW59105.1 hypothetical protein CTA1_887 [Colletotrichum tanaceti]
MPSSTLPLSRHTTPPVGGIRYDTLKTDADALGSYGRYSQSKLANVLWARHMAREYPQFTVASVHPGICQHQSGRGDDRLPQSAAVITCWASPTGGSPAASRRAPRTSSGASVSKDVETGQYY